jgi:NTP pyrophosphatase (non-canonical NTP hydrolase)
MELSEYQKKALVFDYPVGISIKSTEFFAILLGLAGEAGEISEKFKKIYWHRNGDWNDDDKKEMSKELGDLLWYLSSVASHCGLSLEDIAKENITKLTDRKNRGVSKGNGDNR